MRRTIGSGIAVLLAGIMAACGATRPAKYYELESPPAPAVSFNSVSVSLLVGHLTASHLYRDDRIVYATGSQELGTYQYQRWAEPPTEMIETMLVRALRASGQYRSVDRLSSSARGEYIVRGRLDALEEVDRPALAARFAIELDLYHPKSGATLWSQTYVHDEPVKEKKMAAIVEALNRSVQQGLTQLVANLGQYLASHPAQ
jgi:ABC-type uncharacterized transport system auxiliary subunit